MPFSYLGSSMFSPGRVTQFHYKSHSLKATQASE